MEKIQMSTQTGNIHKGRFDSKAGLVESWKPVNIYDL